MSYSKLAGWSFLFWSILLSPLAAVADTHDVKGCLYVMDTRPDSPDEGSWVPVSEAPIKVWYDVLGIDVAALGTLTTNSAGCFSGTLSGFRVPELTTIKIGALTQNSDWMVSNDISPYFIYNYKFTNSRTVTRGNTADFGDMGIPESLGEDHLVFLLFNGMARGINLYEDKTGLAWTGYQDVGVRFPANFTSFGSSYADTLSGIHLMAEDGSDLDTLFHEWGHWVGFNDSSTVVISSDYCADYTGGTVYPFNMAFYHYTDPGRPFCVHGTSSYENDEVSNIEGYAQFFSDFLLSKTGDNDASYDENGLDFWGQNKEANIIGALLDLVDANNESSTYRHIYENPGSAHVTVISGSSLFDPLGNDLGVNATHAFGRSASDEYGIYKAPLSYGGMTRVYTGLSFKPAKVVVDLSSNLCASDTGDTLYCGVTTPLSPLAKVTAPTGTGAIRDMALVDSELFMLTTGSDANEKISRARKKETRFSAPTWNWSEVYTPAADEEIYTIAVDSSKSELYIGGSTVGADGTSTGGWVKSCSLTGPCVPSLILGSTTQRGYQRGRASQTLIDTGPLLNLTWVNNYLYIEDSYGVSRYSKTSASLEQYFGASENSKTFVNNLHRLSYTNGANLFATNGTQSIVQAPDISTGNGDTIYFDDSQPYTTEYFCPSDTATLPAADVVHMYSRVGAYGGDFITDLVNINGMTASIQDSVSENNWLTLNPSQECPAWEDFVKIDDGSGATATAFIPEEEKTSGACLREDDEQLEQYQAGQEITGPLESLTTESITVDDPNKTYPTPTPLKGS